MFSGQPGLGGYLVAVGTLRDDLESVTTAQAGPDEVLIADERHPDRSRTAVAHPSKPRKAQASSLVADSVAGASTGMVMATTH